MDHLNEAQQESSDIQYEIKGSLNVNDSHYKKDMVNSENTSF